MVRKTIGIWLLTISVLLTPLYGSALAVSPHTTGAAPRPPVAAGIERGAADEASATSLSLAPLTAVLIVGPIDGDYGDWTQDEKANMELAAAELEANGVVVHRFYAPNTDWSQITAAAEGAHFLFYRGHGVYWSAMPHPTVGGFALSNGQFISSDDIRQDLHLAPNAIVMLYGCFTAGTSGNDDGDIGIEEAQRRVAQYSDPFFDVGAAGYYADWFGNAFQLFVRYLFEGQTLGEAYESYFDFNPSTVVRSTHPDHPGVSMWLDKDFWYGYWQYNDAFVGLPSETLESLFPPPTLGGLPDELTFTYSIPDQQFLLAEQQLAPTNVTTGDQFTWSLAQDGAWFSASPTGGTTPTSFWVAPDSFNTHTPATYSGALTVTVTDPAGVENSPQQVEVTLHVVDVQFTYTYLPAVSR